MSSTLQAVLEHVEHTTSRATSRTHTVLVDRPVARGGLDKGPVGGEYLTIALGGCFMSHLLAAIRAREAPMSNVRVAVSGTLDGSPERFTAFTLDVTADCSDQALAEKLITIAARSCQVVNTLRLAAPLDVTFRGVVVNAEAATAVGT